MNAPDFWEKTFGLRPATARRELHHAELALRSARIAQAAAVETEKTRYLFDHAPRLGPALREARNALRDHAKRAHLRAAWHTLRAGVLLRAGMIA